MATRINERAVVMTRAGRNTASYDVNPQTAAVVGIDFQLGFGHGVEPVPAAEDAVANFIALARAWRAVDGTVVHAYTTYTQDRVPSGRITDFVPDIGSFLAEGTPMAAFYDGVVEDSDLLVPKTTFSAVLSSQLSSELARHGFDTAVVGGLTTPVCVQTTVDALSMTGTKVCLIEDACASQPIGTLSSEDAHDVAVQRMGYLFASVSTTDSLITHTNTLAADTSE